ncbi:hypothetical protein ACJX0J_019533, partial [Zea mays]
MAAAASLVVQMLIQLISFQNNVLFWDHKIIFQEVSLATEYNTKTQKSKPFIKMILLKKHISLHHG